MANILQEKNLFLVYSKNFFFFTWKFEESDIKNLDSIRSSEFQFLNKTSILEVRVFSKDLCIFLWNKSVNVKPGRFTILISDRTDSIIHSRTVLKPYFAQKVVGRIPLFQGQGALLGGHPSSVVYPIIITCIVKDWISDEESCVKSSKSLTPLNHLEELSSDFKRILDQASYSDIVLRVEGDNIKAHKSILQARSPVFNKMFTHETSDDPIDISDVGSATMKRLLQYLYTGTTEKCGFEETMELYYAADKYGVISLREYNRIELLNLVNVSNACVLFALASRHSDEDFKNEVVSFIKDNIKSVVQEDSFDLLDKEDMKFLMRLSV